jgi:hypothetical protein
VYVQEVEKQVPAAEKAVAEVLRNIFVGKIYRKPAIAFNGLVLYRELLLSASMDYICEDSYFPQAIHQELGKICAYKGEEKDLEKRGKSYFTDVYNIPYDEEGERYGYNLVIFAL